MQRKYNMTEFGHCPRLVCRRQPVVPMGVSDRVHIDVLKIYCPRCRQVYEPTIAPGVQPVDGAYFGTTFPNLFFMSFEHLIPGPIDQVRPSLQSLLLRLEASAPCFILLLETIRFLPWLTISIPSLCPFCYASFSISPLPSSDSLSPA